ncbi:MAG: diguanylate cyclase (GGDEF)-like protein [Gammaproteobacteria bacterium]
MTAPPPAQRVAAVFEDTNESPESMSLRLANISRLHELAMSIGIGLDLHEVLYPFMCCAQRLLGLHSVHFFSCSEAQASARLAATGTHELSGVSAPALPATIDVPDGSSTPAGVQIAQAAFEQEDGLLARTEHDMRCIAMRLPSVGSLVFVQATHCSAAEFTLRECQDLATVFDRLALGCQVCIEHRSMVEQAIAEQAAQAAIAKEASHDSLTELPNRKTLQLRLRQAVAAAIRHEHYGAVFFIDIDRFKTVNDSLGHAGGDAVLVAMARRLEAAARDEDTLARMGGDEFILVASNLGDSAEQAVHAAQALAARLAQDCRRPVDVLGSNVHISTSIGICIYPYYELGIETLDSYCENIIRFADTAMYRTKNQGRDGFAFFAPQMQAAANRRVTLEQQLRLALERDELEVHFQPLVTSFGAVLGAEALLRWNHDDLGRVEPDEFIPVAEESGLIVEIGAWVIEQVCELVQDICASARYPQFSYISINVSPRQLKHMDFVNDVRTCVASSGAPTSGLRLEITEHAAIDNIEDTIAKMKELNAMGIRMSLDDFGTGYSSLSYLHRLPISILKLDRAFVTSIANHEENQAIVDATIAMASHLGIECVPEGIEFEGDVEFFRSRPVHTMQGFYFSAALPRGEFLRVLEHGSLGPMADLVQQLPISWPKDESD